MGSGDHGDDVLPPTERGVDPRVALVVAAAFILLIAPAWFEAAAALPGERRIVAIGLGAAYATGCVLATPMVAHRSLRARRVWSAALLVLAGTLVAVTGSEHTWILIVVLGVVAVLLPGMEVTAVTLVAVTVILMIAAVEGTMAQRLPDVILISTVTLATALLTRLAQAHDELRRTRDDLATVAVLRERTRMAADLHDLLGHSLTTLTLKAGIARRLLDNGDVERATSEVAEVEELGRRALAEVRAAVTDYRTVSLVHEFALARDALTAAGIQYDIPREAPDVDADLRVPFGHVVREGVTNVIRHSGAEHVRIEVAADRVVVEDDGCGPQGPAGNGLTGLRERLADVGGILEIEDAEGGGCRLTARIPAETTEGTP